MEHETSPPLIVMGESEHEIGARLALRVRWLDQVDKAIAFRERQHDKNDPSEEGLLVNVDGMGMSVEDGLLRVVFFTPPQLEAVACALRRFFGQDYFSIDHLVPVAVRHP